MKKIYNISLNDPAVNISYMINTHKVPGKAAKYQVFRVIEALEKMEDITGYVEAGETFEVIVADFKTKAEAQACINRILVMD